MDVRAFSDELLPALADTGIFGQVALRTEGPIADGYARVHEDLFLRFYYNAVTGTISFALIENQQRIWGIDYDPSASSGQVTVGVGICIRRTIPQIT